jgi:hypothetical protein
VVVRQQEIGRVEFAEHLYNLCNEARIGSHTPLDRHEGSCRKTATSGRNLVNA